MDTILIIATVLFGVAVLASAWLVLRRLKDFKTASSDDKSALLLQNQMQELTRRMDQKLTDSTKMMQEHTFASSKMLQDVMRDTTERLTKLDETNRQVISFTDQLKDLQDILKNPKQRGILGEYYLETLLKNVLPLGSYTMQYKLGKDDDGGDLIVDAAVFIKDKIVPIDSKFSLENYNRIVEASDPVERERLEKIFLNDLKQRIVETAKYIKPQQGTMDFAFMFIPHEAIYYDLLINKIGAVKGETENLIQRAAGKYHVLIVSPTSFLAYLQTVMQALRALHIEEQTQEIRGNIDKLGKHLEAYHQNLVKLGSQLGTVVNTYNTANIEFKKIDKDVLKITDSDRELLDAGTVEKPKP
ncbi:MAG: hypothetical protein A3B30_00495 [Candidatus Komeilibacteria bacterium RIFCSPLOWO2_01_FULL_52_15]|uniref:DNA recombination protein RmuC n=1 Tax=Candidatus Komeilibacteria bacterium RIFCSPLOWO2_01_FULL_52_15 TaxID=1798551 RepID=A0A1G2BMI2_9BACT|nr:MAG: hypothetical protein A3B30_00495 [Candidatus Komeilibacteria bacterium RIFCSPLOWO2_01_FULL_52_15]